MKFDLHLNKGIPRISLIQYLYFIIAFTASLNLQAETLQQNGLSVYIEESPTWVDYHEYQAATKIPRGNILYHLYDQQGYGGNPLERYTRIVKEAVNASGLENASQIEITFNPSFQKLTLHSATVYRDGKTIYTLNKDDIKLFSKESELDSKILSGLATSLILVPSTQIGDVIDFSYSIKGSNPVFSNKISTSFDLGWSIPLAYARVRFVAPDDKKIAYKTHATELSPTIRESTLGTTYEWILDNPKPIFNEQQYPYGYDRYPYVSLSEYKSWKDVVNQQKKLYQFDDLPKNLLSELSPIKSLTTSDEKIVASLRFVQEKIRYLGLEYGENAFKPRPIDEVWKNRRGDCKEKTQLLVAILRYFGFDAHPALVNTSYREGVSKVLPAPNRFNHVITHVRLENRSVWLDPTINPQYGSLDDITYNSYGYALILKDSEKSLTSMPNNRADNFQTFITEEISITDYTAPVRLKVTTKYKGRSAERIKSKFENSHIEKIQHEFSQFYSKSYGKVVHTKPINFEFNSTDNEFRIEESYIIDNFFNTETEKVEFNLSAHLVSDYIYTPEYGNRVTPLYIGRPKHIKHQIKIHFPLSELNSNIDTNHKIENDNIHFEFNNIVLPRTYILDFHLHVKDSIVSPSNINQTLTDFKSINNIGFQSFSFKPNSAFVDPIMNKLIHSTLTKSVKHGMISKSSTKGFK